MTKAATVRVSRVSHKDTALDGTYPIMRVEDQTVVITHPKFGAIRVPKSCTDFGAAQTTTLSYDDLLRLIKDRFDTMSDLMDGIVAGTTRSFIVSGAPGVGKSFTINQKLAIGRATGKVKKVYTVKGVISPIGLYKLLWEHRKAGEVIVLDDTDRIFWDEDGANIVKAATDSGKTRTVSYQKEAASLDANGIPLSFTYEGAIVVATNLNFEREVAQNTKAGTHLGAILNRALYLDLGLHSQQALLARVEDVCRSTPLLRDIGLIDSQIDDVVLWLKENQTNVRSLSLRTAEHVAGHIVNKGAKWRKMAAATLLKATAR
jgi:hypothetical protein